MNAVTVSVVTFMDRRSLPLGRWASLLSAREREEVESYRHPLRRERTIASRVLGKYLASRPSTAEFQHFDASVVGGAEWSSVELLSGHAKARRAPVVLDVNMDANGASRWASSAHCGDYSASCVSVRRVGLDLERVEARRPEFYRHSFSAAERDWAASGAAGSVEQAFTLLWCVKEAYLKASPRRDLSLWAFPRWTVWFDQQPTAEFIEVSGGIHADGVSEALGISFMHIDDMILAKIQCRELIQGNANGGKK